MRQCDKAIHIFTQTENLITICHLCVKLQRAFYSRIILYNMHICKEKKNRYVTYNFLTSK